MDDSKIDRLIKNIESMEFKFPYPSIGHGIDKVTGKGESPEIISDEEGLALYIKIKGEPGFRVIGGPQAMQVYETVWQFLNNSESGNRQ